MEIIEAIEEVEEELFPPREGGLVDRHRKRRAAETATAQEAENADEPLEIPAYKAVKVVQESPEIISPVTYTIAAGASAMILPLNMYRYRAVINLVTASATAVLSKDQGQAMSGIGYILASANPILSVFSRAQMWCNNNTGGVIQVSVFAESYAPAQR